MKEILRGIMELLEEEIIYYGNCGADFNEKCTSYNCNEFYKCSSSAKKKERIKKLKEQIEKIK